ncbi:hypothetical protein [Acetobacterium wieringae]|uniref:hypothetical protein n=1 Tax=Acetobacterium wieringae TaxID=52694 RepID=UPI0020348661|nr:hypothetical protein [Acetobacterium wieringae]URN85846.1 hypothetical protein CHL1_001520 [Acetobacterium wieringae]
MNSGLKISSKSKTIGVAEARDLLQMTKTMALGLTMEEYVMIATVFGAACDRILKENGLE